MVEVLDGHAESKVVAQIVEEESDFEYGAQVAHGPVLLGEPRVPADVV